MNGVNPILLGNGNKDGRQDNHHGVGLEKAAQEQNEDIKEKKKNNRTPCELHHQFSDVIWGFGDGENTAQKAAGQS